MRIECLIQVCSCEISYRIELFDIDVTYYHSRRVWLQVHRNLLGDECRIASCFEILPTYCHQFIALR